MNTIALICFFAVIILFLYSVYRIMFVKEKPDMIAKWKVALIVIIISTIFFFIYITVAIGEIGIQQTITDGTDTFVIQSNNYLQAFNLMPLVVAIYSLQWMFFVISILQGFSFFGRQRMQR